MTTDACLQQVTTYQIALMSLEKSCQIHYILGCSVVCDVCKFLMVWNCSFGVLLEAWTSLHLGSL